MYLVILVSLPKPMFGFGMPLTGGYGAVKPPQVCPGIETQLSAGTTGAGGGGTMSGSDTDAQLLSTLSLGLTTTCELPGPQVIVSFVPANALIRSLPPLPLIVD